MQSIPDHDIIIQDRRFYMHGVAFFCHFRLNEEQNIGDQLRQVHRLLFQAEFTALDTRHIQHLIDEGKQMIRCRGYFFQAVLNLIRVIQIGPRNGCHADDAVHWRTDIM